MNSTSIIQVSGRSEPAELRRRGGLREGDFEIRNLCELCVLCGESLFSDLVAAVPRCALLNDPKGVRSCHSAGLPLQFISQQKEI